MNMMSIGGLRDQIDQGRVVETEDVQLSNRQGSIRATLMKNACRREGIDLENPPEVGQYYLRREGLIVFDLRGELDGEQ